MMRFDDADRFAANFEIMADEFATMAEGMQRIQDQIEQLQPCEKWQPLVSEVAKLKIGAVHLQHQGNRAAAVAQGIVDGE